MRIVVGIGVGILIALLLYFLWAFWLGWWWSGRSTVTDLTPEFRNIIGNEYVCQLPLFVLTDTQRGRKRLGVFENLQNWPASAQEYQAFCRDENLIADNGWPPPTRFRVDGVFSVGSKLNGRSRLLEVTMVSGPAAGQQFVVLVEHFMTHSRDGLDSGHVGWRWREFILPPQKSSHGDGGVGP